MKIYSIFLYEWKHFINSPFKLLAFLFFIVAAVYGLHNGASLYHKQMAEIERISHNHEVQKQTYISYFDEGKVGPENRPWIDITTPYWAMSYNELHNFKTPSAAMVYSTGQAEQYGFYKRVSIRASPYDSDMTQEIANPERLQTGTLDFAFSILYLLPLLMLIVLYNIKSAETEQGFFNLIEVQVGSSANWLIARIAFYIFLIILSFISLLFYGALLTPVFTNSVTVFLKLLTLSVLYIAFWTVFFFFIIRNGKSILNNTLKMLSIWLIFCFIIPAVVHQSISIIKPANLMTDFIDAKRDQREDLLKQPVDILQEQLYSLYPEIAESELAKDIERSTSAISRSRLALENELTKKSIYPIELDNQAKNHFIAATYWFNPVMMFQNRVNSITQTHYNDYEQYRNEIQELVDMQLRLMVADIWSEKVVDKNRYIEYTSINAN